MVKDVTPTRPLNDEQQSMQALKHYGGYIISAMILALAGYFGWQFYQNHGGRIDTAAANDFAKLQADQAAITSLSQNPTPDDKTQQQLATANASLSKDLDTFIAQHGNSIYTWQALMLKAKQQMEANDTKAAVTTLQKASQLKIGDAGLEAIATLRYAQALLANNQADEAQKTLQAVLPPSFDASKEEILGDIAMAKNDKNAAIAHYQKAWQAVEARNKDSNVPEDRSLLRLKMQELGLNPKQPTLGVISQPAEPVTVASAPNPASLASSPASDNRVDKVATDKTATVKPTHASAKSASSAQPTDKQADKASVKTSAKQASDGEKSKADDSQK